MEQHGGIDAINLVKEDIWVQNLTEAVVGARLSTWITSLHPQKMPCQSFGPMIRGSYNVCARFLFDDGNSWMLRLPRAKSVRPEYADEKIIVEVEALHLIRERTTIPVPEVKAWGRAKDNPFGLGAFIVMEFIEGAHISSILKRPDTRLLPEDIGDDKVELIYRQMAAFLLQLFKIDFEHIGSLSTPQTGAFVPIRPLTWKVHDILATGGIDTFGDRTKEFSSTAEYFAHVHQKDREQVRYQPNSVPNATRALASYKSLEIIKSLVPRLVHPDYDHGPFKLICDDFGFGNLIVKSEDDFTVVGVVDLEWVYSGPAQLFASAPWWLLQDRPVNEEWDFENVEAPEVTSRRYLKNLEMFIRILEEVEDKMEGYQEKRLSKLMKWTQSSGAMWLHMLLSCGSFSPDTFACGHLREHFGAEWWDSEGSKIEETEEAKEFPDLKMAQYDAYKEELEMIEEQKERVDSGEMTREEFLDLARSIIAEGRKS